MIFRRLHVARAAEAAFRRRAQRRYPNEYMEALWGRIDDDNDIHVIAFMPMEHTGMPARLTYEDDVLDEHETEAKESRLRYLGTIHTHPDCLDSIYSEQDLRDTQNTQDIVMGICAITREMKGKGDGKSRLVCTVQYWPSPRPLEVVYGKTKRKKST